MEIGAFLNVMRRKSGLPYLLLYAAFQSLLHFLLLAIFASFSPRAKAAATPDGATGQVLARAGYDGNFYWTHGSKIYEYALKDHGLSPESYGFGDQIKVYVGNAQNIIKVAAAEAGPDIRTIETAGVSWRFLVPFLLIWGVYIPIVFRTFAKPLATFCRGAEGR